MNRSYNKRIHRVQNGSLSVRTYSATSEFYAFQFLISTTLIFFAFMMAMIIAVNANAETEFSPKIKEAMKTMKEEALKLGEPKNVGIGLYFGSTKINGNYDIVDSLMSRFGCSATFFVKKDDGFLRISTNILTEGVRAIATPLDPKGLAIASIKKNEAYYGIVDILGKKYDTGYEPIKNAGGEIIGIYYIGYRLDN